MNSICNGCQFTDGSLEYCGLGLVPEGSCNSYTNGSAALPPISKLLGQELYTIPRPHTLNLDWEQFSIFDLPHSLIGLQVVICGKPNPEEIGVVVPYYHTPPLYDIPTMKALSTYCGFTSIGVQVSYDHSIVYMYASTRNNNVDSLSILHSSLNPVAIHTAAHTIHGCGNSTVPPHLIEEFRGVVHTTLLQTRGFYDSCPINRG